MPEQSAVAAAPAAAITRNASLQSYLTIRWLADRDYRDDAFAIYAYFRWLDDTVDERLADRDRRLAFVARQRDILVRTAGGATAADLSSLGVTPEEALLVGLARPNPALARGARPTGDGPTAARRADPGSGLLVSLRSMLDVMEFDARRRGRPVAQQELDDYTRDLAVAVTEALHHCIGHGQGSPHDETRYVAVTGAHVAHMLATSPRTSPRGTSTSPPSCSSTGTCPWRTCRLPRCATGSVTASSWRGPASPRVAGTWPAWRTRAAASPATRTSPASSGCWMPSSATGTGCGRAIRNAGRCVAG